VLVLCELLWLAVLLVVQPARAQQEGVRVTEPVSDWAGVIDPGTRARLEGYLWELKQKTGAELAIATVGTTGGVPIEEYALRLVERSGLGQKGKDDGCLVLVAVEDRAYRIEVGYGLEGVLPDGFVGDVGREYFVPYFRAGEYAKGIEQGVVAIARKIAADRGVTLQGVPEPATPRADSWDSMGFGIGVFWWLVAILVLLTLLKPWRRRGVFWGGGSAGGGGFGGGGGGFGSFGGGGGHFGGGGASGRW
jgi:uncharacterized protein